MCRACTERADAPHFPCLKNPGLEHVNPDTGESLKCSGVHAPQPDPSVYGPGLIRLRPTGCGTPCQTVGCFCQHRAGEIGHVTGGRTATLPSPAPPTSTEAVPSLGSETSKREVGGAVERDPREDWHGESDHPGPWQDCDRCTWRLRHNGERHKDDPGRGGLLTEDNIPEDGVRS